MSLSNDHATRLARAHTSLEGLSVGDAFGGMYFSPGFIEQMIENRMLFAPEWDWTDDTQMAVSIYEELCYGSVNQDRLARNFAKRYAPERGYGPSMHGQLQSVRAGTPWQEAAQSQFGGQGTFGNGAAMRIAPLGAYFADDMDSLVENAIRASEVTHAHPEGIAGGVAVAAATAIAAQLAGSPVPTRAEFIDRVLPYIPESDVHTYSKRARDLPQKTSVMLAVARLGNGSKVSAQDTVPFCLWCAGTYLENYEEALWLTLSGYGDRDTTCAIVGGIVAAYTGSESIPSTWLAAREPLPVWIG